MADTVVQFGGCLTVNWHDRSLAPERLWGGCYRDLIQELKGRGAWFSTAGQAISWFRKRRSAVFVTDPFEPRAVRVKVAYEEGNNLPGLRLRVHQEGQPGSLGTHRAKYFVDMTVDDAIEQVFRFEARR